MRTFTLVCLHVYGFPVCAHAHLCTPVSSILQGRVQWYVAEQRPVGWASKYLNFDSKRPRFLAL